MASECVIDAHALLWFLEGNSKLGQSARSLMVDPATLLIIPAIALAEACRVAEKHASTIPSARDLLNAIDADPRMMVDPVDRDLVERTIQLTAIGEMHDRLIAASAVRRKEMNGAAVLLTTDAEITASGVVPVIWQ